VTVSSNSTVKRAIYRQAVYTQSTTVALYKLYKHCVH